MTGGSLTMSCVCTATATQGNRSALPLSTALCAHFGSMPLQLASLIEDGCVAGEHVDSCAVARMVRP